MPAPILATKLYLPSLRPNAVRRPRLIERLNEGLRHADGFGRKLTLLSAPAGFGKTTLLSAWIEAAQRAPAPGAPRFAWLSLDVGDSDPIRFLAYLAAAVQTIAPGTGAGLLAALEAPQPPPAEALLTGWLNEIAALPYAFSLVLDDYHVLEARPVDASTSVDGALAFLLEHLPPRMHLVVATREDPHLPLARLRARSQLAELRAADLLFTPAEAADFLNQVMGLGLTDEAVAALEARTEGWVAGLQLAALALQGTLPGPGQTERAHFIQSFTGSHHFVLDYLLEEVLYRQPESIQKFLLRTSILERMCAPLCEAVLQDPAGRGQETLEYLERANLFSLPLDGERRWYRYHHLFGDLLRQRLSQSQGGERGGVAEDHRRASRWYAENGYPAEAFQHAAAAGDFEQAAAVAELAWPTTFRSYFQNTVFLGWMKALPDEVIRARPVLSAGYAWALLDFGELEAAEAHLQDAERWLDPTSPRTARVVADEAEFGSLPATLALARATLSLAQGHVSGTVGHARRALALLPEGDHFRRAGAMALLGVAYLLSGDLEASARAVVEGMARVQQAGQPAFAISGVPLLAGIRQTQGRLREAAALYERTLQAATLPGEPPLQGAADMALGLCELSLEQNDLPAAEQFLRQSLALGEPAGLPGWHYHRHVVQARLGEIGGDWERALGHLLEAERRFYQTAVPEMRPLAARKVRLWIRRGQVDEALEWVRNSGLSAQDVLSYPREFEHITLARVCLARFQRGREPAALPEAAELLERLRQAAEAGGRTGSQIELLALQALVCQAQGRLPRALPLLEQALELAAPEGHARVFIDEGEPMRQLLAEFGPWREKLSRQPDWNPLGDYVNRLQAAFARPALAGALPWPPVEPLSEREQEVLRLIAQGLSNPEIGERLCVAVSTVKGHNQRLFAKLQAQNRTEAVARARELGLL